MNVVLHHIYKIKEQETSQNNRQTPSKTQPTVNVNQWNRGFCRFGQSHNEFTRAPPPRRWPCEDLPRISTSSNCLGARGSIKLVLETFKNCI